MAAKKKSNPARKATAKKTATKTATRRQAALDKGIHEGVKPGVLGSFEPSHGPTMSDRSDVLGVAEPLPVAPALAEIERAPTRGSDEGQEPGRGR